MNNKTETTLKTYNVSAKDYSRKFKSYQPYVNQMRTFAEMLPEGSSVLDAGCGPGHNARILTDAGHNVSGFDLSESMVELARNNCPEASFEVAGVDDFSFGAGFDAAVFSFLIVHLEDPAVNRLPAKISSCLKVGGLLYLSFMTGKTPGFETTSFSESEIYFNYFDPDRIRSLFTSAGFELAGFEKLPYTEADGSVTGDIFMIFKKT